ncbi:replication-associated recombination protein A [Myxococcota bacterium]|jgi:putative ATPase|nr:replication-associated recombination protein A [Myxococcota bacterium]
MVHQNAPLAERMRPSQLSELIGQEHLIAPGRALHSATRAAVLPSMLLWGPPGCGKTTIARLLVSGRDDHKLLTLSAVTSGTKDLKDAIQRAEDLRRLSGQRAVLFVDEIHRWNKAQQDALLPHVEDGTITLIGATTENPAVEVNRTLLSRMEIVALRPLGEPELRIVLQRALVDEARGLGAQRLKLSEAAEDLLVRMGQGDARLTLGLLERVAESAPAGATLDDDRVRERLGRDSAFLSLGANEHYNLASALIKSMRGSDPDAALYYLARLLTAGEDPVFIARRLVIFASEDVGNADPRAIGVAVDVAQAVALVGMPEGRINLAQGVTYLATAPKSNAAYAGLNRAMALVQRTGAPPPPLHLRNASDALSRREGAGQGYLYPHDHPYGVVAQRHWPDALTEETLYEPVSWGNEKSIAERLAFWRERLKPSGR